MYVHLRISLILSPFCFHYSWNGSILCHVWDFISIQIFCQLNPIKWLLKAVELLIKLEHCGPCCENPSSVLARQSTTLFPACVNVCVLFFQTVIVIPLAQSVIAVMAQDFVNVRRALQGPSVRSVYPAIYGTMAANVSRTATLPTQLGTVLPLSTVSPCSLSLISFLSVLIP